MPLLGVANAWRQRQPTCSRIILEWSGFTPQAGTCFATELVLAPIHCHDVSPPPAPKQRRFKTSYLGPRRGFMVLQVEVAPDQDRQGPRSFSGMRQPPGLWAVISSRCPSVFRSKAGLGKFFAHLVTRGAKEVKDLITILMYIAPHVPPRPLALIARAGFGPIPVIQ
jgi:hypothetical protein